MSIFPKKREEMSIQDQLIELRNLAIKPKGVNSSTQTHACSALSLSMSIVNHKMRYKKSETIQKVAYSCLIYQSKDKDRQKDFALQITPPHFISCLFIFIYLKLTLYLKIYLKLTSILL